MKTLKLRGPLRPNVQDVDDYDNHADHGKFDDEICKLLRIRVSCDYNDFGWASDLLLY